VRALVVEGGYSIKSLSLFSSEERVLWRYLDVRERILQEDKKITQRGAYEFVISITFIHLFGNLLLKRLTTKLTIFL
jgi:hypothetical protein